MGIADWFRGKKVQVSGEEKAEGQKEAPAKPIGEPYKIGDRIGGSY